MRGEDTHRKVEGATFSELFECRVGKMNWKLLVLDFLVLNIALHGAIPVACLFFIRLLIAEPQTRRKFLALLQTMFVSLLVSAAAQGEFESLVYTQESLVLCVIWTLVEFAPVPFLTVEQTKGEIDEIEPVTTSTGAISFARKHARLLILQICYEVGEELQKVYIGHRPAAREAATTKYHRMVTSGSSTLKGTGLDKPATWIVLKNMRHAASHLDFEAIYARYQDLIQNQFIVVREGEVVLNGVDDVPEAAGAVLVLKAIPRLYTSIFTSRRLIMLGVALIFTFETEYPNQRIESIFTFLDDLTGVQSFQSWCSILKLFNECGKGDLRFPDPKPTRNTVLATYRRGKIARAYEPYLMSLPTPLPPLRNAREFGRVFRTIRPAVPPVHPVVSITDSDVHMKAVFLSVAMLELMLEHTEPEAYEYDTLSIP